MNAVLVLPQRIVGELEDPIPPNCQPIEVHVAEVKRLFSPRIRHLFDNEIVARLLSERRIGEIIRESFFDWRVATDVASAGGVSLFDHLVEQRARGRLVRRRHEHFYDDPADARPPRVANHFQVGEPVLQLASDECLDRVDREASAPRELAQPVDDLAPDGAERVLQRGHLRRRIVDSTGRPIQN